MYFVFCLCKLYIHVICFLSFVYVNCKYMSYVLNVFCLCKLYIHVICCIYNLHRQKTKKHMTCIYNLHRQKTFKTYDMYIQFTQTKDKKHMTCIYNLSLCILYIHVICFLSFVYVNCIYMSYVFFLCKLYIHVISFLSFVCVNCIYMSYVFCLLHRQKTKNI
jgi:hypothetical protein